MNNIDRIEYIMQKTNYINYIGKKFGKLTVKDVFKGKTENGDFNTFAYIICDCEPEVLKIKPFSSIRNGDTTTLWLW